MLKRVGHPVDEKGAAVAIKDATFPVPFAPGLEFNSPVHGNWNIAHTGMLMPEARQIYVCADNCMRGVVLTAAEMNAADRFSFVIVKEENLLNGNLEDITIEGVTDVLNKLEEKPKAVLLFTVCLHHFLGCDLERVYQELEERFPKITFIRCYMDPIMQKHGPTPDQKLRKAIYEPLPKRKADEKAVSFLGSDFVLEKNADLKRIVRAHQEIFRELPGCKSWEDYLALSEGKLFISSYPPSKYGAEALSERLKRPYLYLPGSFDYEEITAQLGCARLSFAGEEQLASLLHLTPGSATIFGLQYDTENRVQLVVDRDLLDEAYFGCHPCINTSTIRLKTSDVFDRLTHALHHDYTLVTLKGE